MQIILLVFLPANLPYQESGWSTVSQERTNQLTGSHQPMRFFYLLIVDTPPYIFVYFFIISHTLFNLINSGAFPMKIIIKSLKGPEETIEVINNVII